MAKKTYTYLVKASARRRGAIGVFYEEEFQVDSPTVLEEYRQVSDAVREEYQDEWEINHIISWFGK